MSRGLVIAGVITASLTAVGFGLFELLRVSTQDAIVEPIRIQSSLLSAPGFNLAALIGVTLSKAMVLAVPFIVLSLALAALAAFTIVFGEDKRLGPAAAATGALAGLFLVGPTFASVATAGGMIAASFLVPSMATRAFEEETKWRNYKSVSRAVGRGLIVLNGFVALGVFLTVFTNLPFYTQLYLSETQQTIEPFISDVLTDERVIAQMPSSVREKFDALPDEKKAEFVEEYRELLRGEPVQRQQTGTVLSKLVTAYLYAIPLIVFGVLEFLRSFVLVHIAGVAAVPLLRKRSRFIRTDTIAS